MSLTVVGTIRSRAFRVLWALKEMGLSYNHEAALPQSDEVKKHSSAGKIPVLLDDGITITDSTAILHYLADKHQLLTFPAGSKERAEQDSITFKILDELDAALWTAAKHGFLYPEERRVQGIKEALRWEVARAHKEFGKMLQDRQFLMGDTFTIPDIILTHCLGWGIIAKFGLDDENLSDYFSRMKSRPSYVAARSE